MMTHEEIDVADREALADELGAAGEYTGDWRSATLSDLRERVRELVDRFAVTENDD